MNIGRVMMTAAAVCVAVLLGTYTAHAQVQTGAIAGSVSDTSGAALPGVSVTLSSERLIGGPQTIVTDASGA